MIDYEADDEGKALKKLVRKLGSNRAAYTVLRLRRYRIVHNDFKYQLRAVPNWEVEAFERHNRGMIDIDRLETHAE